MKGKFLAVLALVGMAGMSYAQEREQDSVRVAELGEVVVKAVSAPKGAPFAVSRISKMELQEFSTGGQELPTCLHAPRVWWRGARTDWARVRCTCVCVAVPEAV